MKFPRFRIPNRWIQVLQVLLMILWIGNLQHTDGYFFSYCLVLLAGVFCFFENSRQEQNKFQGYIPAGLLAGMLSAFVAAANYELFTQRLDPEQISYSVNLLLNLFLATCSLLGGWCIFYHIIQFLVRNYETFSLQKELRQHTKKVFWSVFLAVFVIDILYLASCAFPGNLSHDSINQINQIYNGVYSNHHPYWHTMMIRAMISLGFVFTDNVNVAISFYSVFQILLVAGCFAYVMATLYQIGVPGFWLCTTVFLYALMPYNIVYSVTMWKDIPFAVSVCAFVVSTYRILHGMGKRQSLNYLVFTFSGLGFAILRSNGILAFAVTLFAMLLFFRKTMRSTLLIMLGVLILAWFVRGPYLDYTGVSQPDLVESLSIPVQQVARVVDDGKTLTEEEAELLGRIISMDTIREVYNPHLSDPIKNAIRDQNPEYFSANIGQYLKLWLRLGIRYPACYVKAWIDQTKGYWGGGYPYWIYAEVIGNNGLGIAHGEGIPLVARLYQMYFTVVKWIPFFQPFLNIGLHVWAVMVVCLVNLLKKRCEWILSVPVLAIVLTLLVATPVFSEFRYVYALFITTPFLALVSLFGFSGTGEK